MTHDTRPPQAALTAPVTTTVGWLDATRIGPRGRNRSPIGRSEI